MLEIRSSARANLPKGYPTCQRNERQKQRKHACTRPSRHLLCSTSRWQPSCSASEKSEEDVLRREPCKSGNRRERIAPPTWPSHTSDAEMQTPHASTVYLVALQHSFSIKSRDQQDARHKKGTLVLCLSPRVCAASQESLSELMGKLRGRQGLCSL